MALTKSPTVLVVEDEIFVRIVASDSLAESGFQVLEAGDAEEALRVLDAHHDVAVLFTDVNMPGEIDGLALAGIVAAKRPEVKVVVTSGREWIDNSRLPDRGIYLAKPYRAAELSSIIRAQAERH